ncbi:hypothetical protein [Actinokineospora sp. NBRC 105648]|uniref:hypothetical protein n=1 Tax=Actinokineospora sp. NBRC 105648 TaxID=3032206 RepID=UPI0024A5B575|nr:hypothetical protein [Actinokineospora sp. NBRC 105648]GLZ39484.1 hypothetical protein Acsp05_31080 [Actinokineospora sp. NBRC 105648]
MGRTSGSGRALLVIGVSALSLAVCCGLAWWQWQRFESANGTFQNLGYVLQWPLFGIAPAYMFWRFRKLRERELQAPPPEVSPRPAPVVHPLDSDEPDDELTAYNRYLARLNADQESR